VQETSSPRPVGRGAFLVLIYGNAFATGAIVMAFEMLGSRYLNPYFGSGIYTWAALIATILLALAVGYFLGGWLADRWPRAEALGGLILLASVYLLAVPLFVSGLFELVFDLIEDVRLGSLIGAVALTLIPVSLLGVYSPFAIRLTLQATDHSGRVAGRIYGVSTLGSIFGTLGTTFFLIPAIGTAAITAWLGGIGIVCALTFFAARPLVAAAVSERRTTAALVLLLLALAASGAPAEASQRLSARQLLEMPDGLLQEIESEYNNIYVRKAGTLLKMSFRRYGNDYTESVLDLLDKDNLAVPYTRLMTVGVAFAERPRSLLMIGLGGGSTSSYLVRHMPGLSADVVELDPGVIAAADRYFGIRETDRYKVHESDGRVFLLRNKATHDVIMVDAFRGGYVPFHMLTREFYELVAKRLAPGGVAVFNVQTGTRLFRATVATLKSVFPTVIGFGKPNLSGNVVVVASLQTSIGIGAVAQRARALQDASRFRYDLTQLVREAIDLDRVPGDTVLTDDFAPANLYEAIEVENAKKW